MITLTTVIPVYNGERYIAKTLQSVAQQTRRPDRLVVLDNCSTDKTAEIVAEFRGTSCEWRRNERNLGMFGNLNRALDLAAETEHLHLLHADDLIRPAFYERCLSALAPTQGRALAYSLPDFIDENDQPAATGHRPANTPPTSLSRKGFLVARSELQPIYFPGILLKTSGQPTPCQFRLAMPHTADHVFWAEWGNHSELIQRLPPGLCQYRLHGGSGTSSNVSSLQSWVLDEWKAMQLIAPLLNETFPMRWVRQQKLKCIFAARSRVKIQRVRANAPDFARIIRQETLKIVGTACWEAGSLAVLLRDLFAASSSRP
jgi:glycosyltransferase involved in cell wall biosynthesis